VATVRAPDAKSAVMVAAVKLRLRRPEDVKRLAAFRLDPAPSGGPVMNDDLVT
jgi:hypothetical protein